eukprot:scaffold256_cov261-Pinguiococcus_pyrenoidosus.AAC.29
MQRAWLLFLASHSFLSGSSRVLVPLCGKTIDLPFIASQEWVETAVGTEGVDQAVEEFAEEQPDLQLSWSDDSDTAPFRKMSSADGRLQLLVGDHFMLNKDNGGTPSAWKAQGKFGSADSCVAPILGEFDAVYDRASLVAITPELRELLTPLPSRLLQQYVDIMYDVLKPKGQILLVTLERRKGSPEVGHPRLASGARWDLELMEAMGCDQAVAAGPPFSVTEEIVRSLYEKDNRFEVNLLEDRDINLDSEMTKFKDGGVDELHELAFHIKKAA